MELLGRPVLIQNTDERVWLVTCDDLVTTTQGEAVSFTTAVPQGTQSLAEIQRQAAQRAIELLQDFLKVSTAP